MASVTLREVRSVGGWSNRFLMTLGRDRDFWRWRTSILHMESLTTGC